MLAQHRTEDDQRSCCIHVPVTAGDVADRPTTCSTGRFSRLLLLWLLGIALVSGCARVQVRLEPTECQATADRFRELLDQYRDPAAYQLTKGIVSYEEFREFYAEIKTLHLGMSPGESGEYEVVGYTKNEEAIRADYEELLAQPILDPASLVDALPRLSLRPGFVLDYVYCERPSWGTAVLYARHVNSTPFRDWQSLADTFENHFVSFGPHYLEALAVDGSPMSFFELAVLVQGGNTFYRHGDAGWSERVVCDITLLCTDDEKAQYGQQHPNCPWSLHLPREIAGRLQGVSMVPYVDMTRETAVVSFVSSDYSCGVARHWWTFQRQVPHCLIERRSVELAPGWQEQVQDEILRGVRNGTP